MRQSSSEMDLIGRMQAGDTAAVGELASMYGPRIQQLAFRYVKNWEDAEEVAQDVLLKVYRKIDAFRGDAALSSWIYRITFNTAMSRLRTGRAPRAADRQKGHVDATVRTQPPAAGAGGLVDLADDHVLRGEMRQRLIGALTSPANGLPCAGDSAGYPGVVDRGGERGAAGQAADAQVATPSRPADPS